MTDNNKLEYAGFWFRVWAMIIDGFLIYIIILPILFSIYGSDYLLNNEWFPQPMDFLLRFVFPFIATILFWKYRQATPGKMVISAKIVDARTGEKPSTGQFVGRYLAYIPSTLILGLGILWVAFDKKKQGWHDKLAGTVVVRNTNEVTFET